MFVSVETLIHRSSSYHPTRSLFCCLPICRLRCQADHASGGANFRNEPSSNVCSLFSVARSQLSIVLLCFFKPPSPPLTRLMKVSLSLVQRVHPLAPGRPLLGQIEIFISHSLPSRPRSNDFPSAAAVLPATCDTLF